MKEPARLIKSTFGALLDIQLASVQIKGELAAASSNGIDRHSQWSLSSEGRVDSKDLRNHLDWLFDRIGPYRAQLQSLREMGCEFLIACYWLSRVGEGGPTFSVSQIKKLAEFEFEIWLDIYFADGPMSK